MEPFTDTQIPLSRAEQMTALLGSSAVGVATGTVDHVDEANDEMLRILGRDREDLARGISWMGVGRPSDAERDAKAFDHLRRDGSTVVVKELVRPMTVCMSVSPKAS